MKYVINPDVIKARAGIYKDTAENRSKHRVGLRYGSQNIEKFYEQSVKRISDLKDILESHKNENTDYILAPPKRMERIKEKIETDYSGDFRKIKDIIRSTIICKNVEECKKVYNKLNKEHKIIKAFFDFQSKTYQGANIVINLKGVPAEIQINTPVNIALKENIDHPALKSTFEILKQSGIKPGMGHKYYEIWRKNTPDSPTALQVNQHMVRYYGQRELFK
jgi:hypothetical protein